MDNTLDGFEVFEGFHSHAAKELRRVTIHKGGNFSLNKASYQALESPERVRFLYNRAKRLVALHAATVEPGAAVRKQPNSHNYIVSGVAFCHAYDIEAEETRRYQATLEEGMLIIDLNTPEKETATGWANS